MSVCILGKKIGMTQVFQEDGTEVPVTVVEAGPCAVLQKKLSNTDKYSAVQLGFDERKPKNVTKPMLKHFEKSNSKPMRFVREMRLDSDEQVNQYEVGKQINVEIFKKGEYIDVIGTSKGKGYAGVMKRHNMGGGKGSHGTHEFFRHGGSVGQHSDPSRVFKGLRMPGRMGTEKVTSVNLEIVDIQPEKNILLIKGSVPGRKNSYLVIRPSKHHTK